MFLIDTETLELKKCVTLNIHDESILEHLGKFDYSQFIRDNKYFFNTMHPKHVSPFSGCFIFDLDGDLIAFLSQTHVVPDYNSKDMVFLINKSEHDVYIKSIALDDIHTLRNKICNEKVIQMSEVCPDSNSVFV